VGLSAALGRSASPASMYERSEEVRQQDGKGRQRVSQTHRSLPRLFLMVIVRNRPVAVNWKIRITAPGFTAFKFPPIHSKRTRKTSHTNARTQRATCLARSLPSVQTIMASKPSSSENIVAQKVRKYLNPQ
jgi:hypothetical protein